MHNFDYRPQTFDTCRDSKDLLALIETSVQKGVEIDINAFHVTAHNLYSNGKLDVDDMMKLNELTPGFETPIKIIDQVAIVASVSLLFVHLLGGEGPQKQDEAKLILEYMPKARDFGDFNNARNRNNN